MQKYRPDFIYPNDIFKLNIDNININPNMEKKTLSIALSRTYGALGGSYHQAQYF